MTRTRHPNLPLLDGATAAGVPLPTELHVDFVHRWLAACGMFAGANPTTHTHNPDESETT